MCDPFNWSISVGRWFGLEVRLHAFLLALAAGTLYLCWPTTAPSPMGDMLWIASGAFLLLLLSVLIHELSHWRVVRRLGFEPDSIVLGPFGGVTAWQLPPGAGHELRFLAAGPLANLLLCVVCLGLVWGIDSSRSLGSLLNPLEPAWLVDEAIDGTQGSHIAHWINVALWINWLLFLVNLLPAYPFDGGRALQAAFASARPDMDRRRAAGFVFWIAIVTSAAMIGLALSYWKHGNDSLFPTWFALALLGVILMVGARRDLDMAVNRERADLQTQAHRPISIALEWADPDVEPWGREDDATTPLDEEIRPLADEGVDVERDEEQRVDEILSHVHAYGMDSLTAEQRALLERVSARYRNRSPRRS